MITEKDILCQADKTVFEIYDRAIDHFDNAIFVELGCFEGGSIIYLARKIKEKKKNIIVYAVDKWDISTTFSQFWNNIVRAGCSDIIKPIQYNSSSAAQLFYTNPVDFVFVDADHSYGACLADIRCWRIMIKPDGWIAGHDYYESSVAEAVHKCFEKKDIEVLVDDTERNLGVAKKSWLVKNLTK